MAEFVRKKISNAEASKLGLAPDSGVSRKKISNEEFESLSGEPGHAGADQYKTPPQTAGGEALGTGEPPGTLGDAAKSWADKAALGAGPQIAGAMGAVMHAATAPLNHDATSDLDAYRDVRDSTAKELRASESTGAGRAITPLALISTPIPVKGLGPGASVGEKVAQGAKVGGVVGAGSGLMNSKADLTRPTPENLKRALVDALVSGTIGAGGGALGGAALGTAEPALRSTAETQALRAAGLRGGIKNSIQNDLGLSSMDEARQLGRQFLDNKLIPAVGSSESVASRARNLEGQAGQSIGSIMNEADVATMHTPQAPQAQGQTSAGRPSNVTPPRPGFDYDAMSRAGHRVLDDASAPADLLSGAKSRSLADAFKEQGERTPGSFVGANKAKSDAWRSANFSADAPMSASLYRKTVGAGRDNIARQVADALGPEKAADLGAANQKFGVAADALKLAENASTRDAAKQLVTTGDVLALLSGGTAGGFAGHPTAGVGTGLGLTLGKKAFDKYGHSSASRFADFLGNRAAESSGGATAGALAPYLELLAEEKK